jgi:hypothetical protein
MDSAAINTLVAERASLILVVVLIAARCGPPT